MVNKLRKTPSGASLPPGSGAPPVHAQPARREKAPRSRSLSDALGGLKLRAAATQVHESLSSLRRSGSTRIKSALKRRHSAPAEMEHPAPTTPLTPMRAELPGSPGVAATVHFNPDALLEVAGPRVKRFILDGEPYVQHGNDIPKRVPQPTPARRPPTPARTPPPDALGMLRADFVGNDLLQTAERLAHGTEFAQLREAAIRSADIDALARLDNDLNALLRKTWRQTDVLRARFDPLPLGARTRVLIEQAASDVERSLMAEKLALMDALKRLREPPPLPPRPPRSPQAQVHELP